MPERPRPRDDDGPPAVPPASAGDAGAGDPGAGDALPIRCTVSWPRPDVCVVAVAGELDIATTPRVAAYLRRQTLPRPAELVLDLGGVTLLAAAGMALIAAASAGDGGTHGRLHLVGVTGNRPVHRALRITGLLAVLDVQDDLGALLDRLR